MYHSTLPVVPRAPSIPRPAAGDGRGERRRTSLLDATLRVVAREGAAGASHRAVAAEAGVPLGSTTYYFASRDEMLVEALQHAATREIEAIRARLDRLTSRPPGTVDWTAEVVRYVGDQLRPDATPTLLARYHLQLEATRRPELRAIYGAWTAAGLELAETMLRAAGSPDPTGDAPVLVAALDGVALNQLILLDGKARSRAVRALVTRLMDRLTSDA